MTLDGFVPPLIILAAALVLLAWRHFVLKGGGQIADLAIVLALMVVAGGLELAMGRPVKYRNGPVRLWSGDIKSDQNSESKHQLLSVILLLWLVLLGFPWSSFLFRKD